MMPNGAKKLQIFDAGLYYNKMERERNLEFVSISIDASRDIAAGDELLINYSEFEQFEGKSQLGWVDFGIGVGITIGQ
jgi:hypothetical protein